jgi:virulence-associated protein VapD
MSTADNVIKIKQSTKRCESTKVERTKANGYKSTKVALVKYKDLFGDMLVPSKLIVPVGNITWPEETWGNKLGRTVMNIRAGKSCVNEREDLRSIGFKFDLRADRYQLIKVALVKYKDLFGDMLVTRAFITPIGNATWPEETWGMKLGLAVKDIRSGKSYVDKRADLESIGFDYSSQSRSHGYDKIKTALLTYQVLNDDMLVPSVFVVPTNDITWPEETWGIPLGSVVSCIRYGNSHVDKRADLESIGFNFNPQTTRYERIKTALLTYQALNDDMLVPSNFIVPTTDVVWPTNTWGMRLGRFVFHIRSGDTFIDKRADLESIRFDYSSQSRSHGYDKIKTALLTYQVLNDDMLVPSVFVVPTNDITWPEETWGISLGSAVSNIRYGSSHVDKRADLESIGFDYSSQSLYHEYDKIKKAFLTYQAFHDDMLVPRVFVVPADDVTWPEETWGIPLGTVVNSIRRGNSHIDKRADLESIGFDYSSQSLYHEYDMIKTALLTYQVLNDDMLVPKRFVVPTDDVTWPEEAWGIPLGTAVSNIRRGNSHVDKRADLGSMGFDYSSQLEDFPSEMKCREIFEELYFPSTFDNAYPPWLKSPTTSGQLQLDGYNEGLNIAFEYQGEQHDKLSYYNHYDKEIFDRQQGNDRFKVTECKSKGITLIVIPQEFTSKTPIAMKKVIMSELMKHGKYPLS